MAEHSMCQPGRPGPHGDSQDASSKSGLLRLQEGEVALIALQRGFSSWAIISSSFAPDSRAVVGKARNTRSRRPRWATYARSLFDERLDEAHDLLDRLRRTRFDVGPSEPKSVRILEEPRRRALG